MFLDFVIKDIGKRWHILKKKNINLPFFEFLAALCLVINSASFSFNNVIYKLQIFGMPMGSPLSLILADIVIQDLESALEGSALADFFHIPFYLR